MPIAPEQMKALLDRIRQTYDYCLIDAPAGLGMGFHLASDYADRAVVVTNTDASSLRDAQRTVMELDRLGRGNLHLVVGRVEKKLLRSLHTTIDDAMDAAGLPLLGVVPEDPERPLCPEHRHPLAGVQQLRRKGLREYCTAHHGAAYPPDAYLNP